jgi:hypothetical protein
MLTIKKGDDEIKRRRQKNSLFADLMRILKTEQSLSRILDLENIDISEFRIIHRLAQAKTASQP